MDANQWPLVSLDDDVEKASEEEEVVERKARPQKDCPRCKSTNTKFCYYNNYSLSQPRYFCKTCRRYWTEGGTLRKVPVGGGSRKNKRSTSTNSISLKKKLPCLQPSTNYQNPNKIRGIHDLNLGYEHNQLSCVTPILSFGELGQNPNLSSSSSCHLSFVGTTMPFCGDATNTNTSAVFNPPHPHEYFKLPRFNFCLDGQLDHDQIGNNYGNITSTIQQAAGMLHETSTRVLHHPYEVQRNYKQFTTSVDDQYDEEEEEEQNKGQYWGGGSW